MRRSKLLIFFIITVLLGGFFPASTFGAETGKVTVDFRGMSGLEERETSAFVDSRTSTVTLPLRYSARNIGVGLTAFANNPVVAIASDGAGLLVSSSNGALAYVSEAGSAQNLTEGISNAKKINGVALLSGRNVWVVGGESRNGQGAFLATLTQGAFGAHDFQVEAKAAELDRIDAVACSSSGCLLYGVKGFGQKRVAFFDGETISNVTEGIPFNTGTPWKVAAGDAGLVLAGIYKDTSGVADPYLTRLYAYEQGSWRKITDDALMKSRKESRIGLGSASGVLFLAKRAAGTDQPFQAWKIGSNLFSEVTGQFRDVSANLTFDPVVGGTQGQPVVGGNGLLAGLGQGMELSSGRIPELQGVDVSAMSALGDKLVVGGKAKGETALFTLTVDGFVPSAVVETKKLASTGRNKFFSEAVLNVDSSAPDGTSFEYALSPDGRGHFETLTPGQTHDFRFAGEELHARVTLFTNDTLKTPTLKTLTIDFVKDDVETEATLKKRDSTRLSDFRQIARALEEFKKDRRSYPIVDAPEPLQRYELLKRMLADGKYLRKLPQDPLYDRDTTRVYDYLPAKSGQAYILRARFDELSGKKLEDDIDGKPIEPHLYEYTCDDPWYCQGIGVSPQGTSVEPAPEPRGTAELVLSDDGRVYRIATVGAGAGARRRKIYIPSPEVLQKLRTYYSQMRAIGRDELASVPRARLVKTEDKADVYYITDSMLKRWIPNWAVFTSYDNDPTEIITLKSEELEAYGESKLIQLAGDARVWLLEGGGRRHITSPAVFLRQGFRWNHISPVNWTEYQVYPEGAPLQ
ncbi:hypothetical protein HY477_03055 [Candidatus Uhrbacteria bacterium]|nr:hypothetical protein [Candidatus Uhrbacteria bacterium]